MKQKKNEFEDLDVVFKDEVAALSPDKIRELISKVALDNVQVVEDEKNDQDLKEKKRAAKKAGAQYREGKKANTLRIKYCKQVLSDNGAI